MKQEYIDNLREVFGKENFEESTCEAIIEKYSAWYEKLLGEGKSDEEIQVILKSPEEVVGVFKEKYLQTTNPTPTTNIEVDETVKVEVETTEQVVDTEDKGELPFGVKARNYPNGKTVYFRKRSFGSAVGVFFVFLLVSFFALPILMTLFSASLTVSFAAMLFFFTPLYYIAFIIQNGDITYLQPEQWGVITDKAGQVLSVPAEIANNVIEKINSITSFSFSLFFETVVVSLFAFAILLIGLYATLQFFKLMVAYFAWFFDKIGNKKIEL